MEQQQLQKNLQSVQELLSQHDTIGIVVTEYQTLDKVGAGLALYLALQEAGKHVQIVSQKDPLVEISNLVGIDKLKKSFEGTTSKLVVSLPYREGEVEKVSYNIEGNKLNINLFAAKEKSISFTDQDVQYIRTGSAPSLIFTIGIRKQEEMAKLVSPDSNARIVRLDTVNPQQDFGDVTLADSTFSSVSEIVSVLLRELKLPVDQDTAQNLMDGIVAVTNNFSSPQTSPTAFASAAFLLTHNAKRKQQARESGGSGGGGGREPRGDAPKRQPQKIQMQEQVIEQAAPVAQEPIAQKTTAQEPIQEFTNGQNQNTDEVPSDWFVPKVFKSSKPQE